ncbi:hypothetical protein ANCCEY_01356 [Ancylostoma ceylanicum]|uniref:3',5'-cyclic-AMP phosphodiesterase n=1 Tax=Ancylostoma ceylanicum TaxID=53326 RepID=A0A0D6MAD2_9BILA|nr:hypothetical protein ANCCEY_01356 [Ancylostoma ceylanicum]
MLNKELSHFAESSKSGTQVSKFLITTYMDKDDDDPTIEIEVPGEGPSTSSPQLSMGLLKKAQTAAMNRISGVRKLRAPSHEGHLPEYGVACAKEVAVYMQQCFGALGIIANAYSFENIKQNLKTLSL